MAEARHSVSPTAEVGFADLPKPWLRQLITQHLGNAELLVLFKTSRNLATVVTQHAASVVLTLGNHQAEAARSWPTTGTTCACNFQVIFSLAAGCTRLHLAVHGPHLQSPIPEQLWPSITQLSLKWVPLTHQVIHQVLQLPQLRCLHSLTVVEPDQLKFLHNLTVAQAESGSSHLHGAINLADAVTGLTSLCSLRYEGLSESEVLASLAAFSTTVGGQLTQLVVNHTAALCELSKFPALRQLEVHKSHHPISTLPAPSKHLVEQLLAHPHLTHVTLPSWPCNMGDAHQLRTHACNWQMLHLTEPVDVEVLSVLPLHGIKRLRLTHAIHQFFSDQQITVAVLQQISQNVECAPVTGRADSAALGIPADVPVFSITPQDPSLLAIFTRTLHGALQLHWFDVGRDALPALSALPAAVHTLCLSHWSLQRSCRWEDVFRALPSHLDHLIINSSGLSKDEVLSLFEHLPTNLTEFTLGPAYFPTSSRTELEEQVRFAARAHGVRFKWCRQIRLVG